MKIIVVNTYYYPAFSGGAEVSVKLLAEGIAGAGHEVYVMTLADRNKVYRLNNVTVICLKQRNIFNSYLRKHKAGRIAKTIWHLVDSCNFLYHFQISALLDRIKPDLVHTNNIQGFSPFLWLTIKAKNIPLIHTIRDYYFLCHKCNMYDNAQNCRVLCTPCRVTHQIKKNFFHYPDHFVAISTFIETKYREILQVTGWKSAVIYNGTDPGNGQAAGPAAEKVCFGYIGRLAEDKGVLYLADEISKLTELERSAIKVIFAGAGEESFISRIKSMMQGVEFEFLGVTIPDVFYKLIDVLLVPALWNEPFGRIVIESLSHNVPVCQSDRGGLKELYNPENSWLFSPLAGNLTGCIRHIINNRSELSQKKANCGKGQLAFSSSVCLDNYLRLYENYLPEVVKSVLV